MAKGSSLKDRLKRLFRSQKLGVLATQRGNNPYTNLIAFACSDDLKKIVFATEKATGKFENILSNSNVSFFIDNRTNKAGDFKKAIGVTASGSARQIRKDKKNKLMRSYIKKHPQLESFLRSPSCALVCIDVRSYYVVQQFENVTEIRIEK